MPIKVRVKLRSNGGSVSMDDLSFMRIKRKEKLKGSSIAYYKNIIERMNQKLEEMGHIKQRIPNEFYWELYGRDEIMVAIVKAQHEIHKIDNPDDICQKITPIMSCLDMVPSIPSSTIAKWVSFKTQLRNNDYYQEFCQRHGVNQRKRNTERKEREVPDWDKLRQRLEEISTDITQDRRLRVICTLFKYGYVFRFGVLQATRLNSESKDDENYNYLDLGTGEWIINKTKSTKRTIFLPQEVLDELQDIIHLRYAPFSCGCLVPQARDKPFKVRMCLTRFPPWRDAKLPDNTCCRKSFETWLWYNSDQNADEVQKLSQILDHHSGCAIINYTPAYDLRKTND